MPPATGTIAGLGISGLLAAGALTFVSGVGDGGSDRSSDGEPEAVFTAAPRWARQAWSPPARIYVVDSEGDVGTVYIPDESAVPGRGSAPVPPQVAVVPRGISLAEIEGFNFQRTSEGQRPFEIVDLR